eukprot:scaffold657391_cov59-Prasinocladus_malaysianus.AAC.1
MYGLSASEGKVNSPKMHLFRPRLRAHYEAAHGSCLISGGTGILGTLTAEWVAKQWRSAPVLLGRTGR